jgi:hypothetical protein
MPRPLGRLSPRHRNQKGTTTMFKGLVPSLVIIAALLTAVPAAVVAAF